MVEILLRDNVAVFKPLGWSRIWTFSDPVSVPFSAIRAVRRAPAGVGRGWWKGWRIPGTHIPGIIVAGSYLDKGAWTFWDVRGAGDNAIEVELDGVRFKRLIVDVGDPDAEQQRLENVITRRAS
jgi:hypothetical protein